MNEHLPSFRLSPQQESILSVGGDNPTAWQCTFSLPAGSTADDVQSALKRAVERYEILRTTFVRAPGARVPVAQTIHESLPPVWAVASGTEDRASLRARELESLDLESGPVLRALLLEGDTAPQLVLTAAAACLDLESFVLLAQELAGAEAQAEPLQYADYADWRSELLAVDDTEAKEGRDAWIQLVGDLPQPQRLLFGTDADGVTRIREQVAVSLSNELIDMITAAAAEQRVPLELFVEAAWHALIARLTGTENVVVAGLVDGRSQGELEGAIGSYAQALPIRTRIEAATSFAEVLDQVRRERNAATRRQDHVGPRQLTAIREQSSATYIAADAPQLLTLASTAGGPPLELVWVKDGRAFVQYDPSAYSRDDAERIAGHLRVIFASAAAGPTQRVSLLNLVDEDDRRRLVALADGAAAEIPDRTLHELFEEQAGRTPQLPAVAGAGETLTYAELNERANQLAHHLRTLRVSRNEPVGLCLDRSPAMLTALLAILKAGGAYLPLNFEHPQARLSHQIEESGARVVVTHSEFLERLPGEAIRLCIDEAGEELALQPTNNPEQLNEPDDLIYVMYTSGSTGLPKGVAVTHRNVVNYTAALAERLAPEQGLNFAVVSAISTDLGNTSIFPALVSGGCIHLIGPQMSMDGEAFSACAGDNPIDILKITPSHLRALLRAGTGFLPQRWLVLGGEASSWELIDEIRSAGDCRILNHYGPTETTIGCCTFEVGDERPAEQPATVPIGRPISNLRAFILGPDGGPTPIGVAGELCIGGAGVARGYVNRPDETSARFVADRFFGEGRVYRTGDRARFLRDGNIEFLGRIDEQLKIRGFRVEPGEIEAALARHPAVSEAAVVAHADGDGDPRLVAYVVAKAQPDAGELRSFLGQSLPEFMVPSLYEPIDALPLTASGKVDRRALPEPGQSASRRDGVYIAPRDELEAEIADIWEQLLKVEQVSVNDDFFALGGHSLLATQAVIRMRRSYGNIPLGAMFNASTVAALADVIRASRESVVTETSAS